MLLNLFLILLNVTCSIMNYWLDNIWTSGFTAGVSFFLIGIFITELF